MLVLQDRRDQRLYKLLPTSSSSGSRVESTVGCGLVIYIYGVIEYWFQVRGFVAMTFLAGKGFALLSPPHPYT